MKNFYLSCLMLFSIPTFAFDLPLPSIPFPAPGTSEVLFVVRNTSQKMEVTVDNYWTNRTTTRIPYKFLLPQGQSVFSTDGTKWLSASITLNLNYSKFTAAVIAGYKDGYSTTFVNSGDTDVSQSYNSISDFVGTQHTIPYNTSFVGESHGSPFYVYTESYRSGNGDVIVLCIADDESAIQCRSQQ